jgi:RNA polymerase sigma factor (sigma-70 family)
MQTEDGSLIYKCLNGEPEAFGLLVDKYRNGIYAYVYAKLKNFHDAQDVAQEVFIRAYRDLHTLRKWDSFVFWLYRIASAQCGKWIRKKARHPDPLFIEDQEPSVLDNPSIDFYRESKVSESLRESLDSLPDDYREVLTLHYLGGMKIMEIAKSLSISPRTVARRLKEARLQLKEEMITMIYETVKQHKLPSIFTFQIVEAVKRIHPQPTISKSLPWGLSLATGLIIAFFGIGQHIISLENPMILSNTYSAGETRVMEVGEYPVDVMKVSNIPIIASQGIGNGAGNGLPSLQNALFMAPRGEGGEWVKKADMPTARVCLSTSEVDGIIYAIGGWDGSSFFSTVEAYNPKTDTWTKKKDMPTARCGLFTSVVDGIIYAIGGWNWPAGPGYLSTVEAYDPKTDKWTRKADMPIAKDWASTSVVDEIIYVIGGWNDTVLSAVEAYDPKTDTWTKKADMPVAREMHSAIVVNKKIYAIGGWEGPDGHLSSSVVEYDPITDSWTTKPDMSTARVLLSASLVNGKIYAIGGGTTWNVALNEGVVEEYTPEGWPFAVSSQMKQPTKWGTMKQRGN